MSNTVTRNFRMNSLNAVFTINEKRAFRVAEIQLISDGRLRKTYTVTAKYDGTNVSYTRTVTDVYASSTFNDLQGVNYTRYSEIEIEIDQYQVANEDLDVVDLYVKIEYINGIFEEMFDEPTGALRVVYTAESDNVIYADNTSYGGGSAWAGTPPTSVQQAITRLANAVASLLSGQIPE